jgi:glutathione peroxidase
MKHVIIISLVMISSVIMAQPGKTFYDFTVRTIDGQTISLSQFKGKKVLVVNTASKCGLTPQYEDLEKLYKQYGGEHFTIIGFPANNFMKQEPGTNEEIRQFCSETYGVSFPMMAKISVKGDDIDPLYQWLTSKDLNGVMDAPVSWNFQKFMIDENGYLAGMAPPKEKPFSENIVNWITGN